MAAPYKEMIMIRLLLTVMTAAVVSTSTSSTFGTTYYATARNAIRDHAPADGIPDEVTPHSSNYVYHSHPISLPSYVGESRTFTEFDISKQSATVAEATLFFAAFRYNSPHVPDQHVSVFAYNGNGAISLDDWTQPSVFVGTTPSIEGFDPSGNNRGERIPFSLNVTEAFNDAVSASSTHVGFSFQNLIDTAINNTDPLGYSSLLTVGNYRLETAIPEPTALALLVLGFPVLLRRRACVAQKR